MDVSGNSPHAHFPAGRVFYSILVYFSVEMLGLHLITTTVFSVWEETNTNFKIRCWQMTWISIHFMSVLCKCICLVFSMTATQLHAIIQSVVGQAALDVTGLEIVVMWNNRKGENIVWGAFCRKTVGKTMCLEYSWNFTAFCSCIFSYTCIKHFSQFWRKSPFSDYFYTLFSDFYTISILYPLK